jgi:hypothetical protein
VNVAYKTFLQLRHFRKEMTAQIINVHQSHEERKRFLIGHLKGKSDHEIVGGTNDVH